MRSALLVLLLLAPTLLQNAAAAAGDEHYLYANQAIVQPGQAFSIRIGGPAPGPILLRVTHVADPLAITDLNVRERLGPLATVTEMTIDLETYGGSWGDRNVALGPYAAGLYLIETRRGEAAQRAFVQVTEVTFLTKTGPGHAILYAFRVADGEPVAGARVAANGTDVGRTGADGILEIPTTAAKGVLALTSGAHVGVSESGAAAWGWGWWGDTARTKVLTWFDRPIYRPGDEVRYKTLVLSREGDRWEPRAGDAVRIRVQTYTRGQPDVIHSATLSVGAHGTAAGAFRLAADVAHGSYSAETVTTDGAVGSGGFEVDAYRKPRVKVDVAAAKDHYVSGETILFRADAAWFFGTPLARGAVKYTITEAPSWSYWGDCRFCASTASLWAGDLAMPYWGERTVAEGTGALERDGSFTFSFKPDAVAGATRYRATVSVTAESGEQQTESGSAVVHPSALEVELRTDSYVHDPGQPLVARATVRDIAGALRTGVAVVFELVEERGGGRVTANAVSNSEGQASATLATPLAEGSWRLTATVVDSGGREAESSRWIWAYGGSRYSWYDGGVMLIPQKERYAPGETARVVLLANRPGAYLVTVEGSDLHSWQVVRVTSSSTVVDLPLAARHAPGVYVTATGVSAPPSEYGPQVREARVQLDVLPDPRELTIEILPDKPVYRDGETARLLVRVTDRDGNPVVAEVAIAVVDEAIFALQQDRTPTLLSWAYPLSQSVQTSYPWYGLRYGRGFATMELAAGRAAASSFMAFDDSDGFAAAVPKAFSADIKVRESFPDTAAWLPFVVTGADGIARIEMTAPDTLTEWRVTARAASVDGFVGDATATFHTRKPLMVELTLPRFLVHGDRLDLTAVAWNQIGELRDVELQLEALGGIALDGTGHRIVTLSNGDSVRIDFPATAISTGTANVTLYARAAGETEETDAYRVRIPIVAHGVVHRASRAGADDASFALPIPPGPYSAAPQLTVTLTPSVAGTVLDALPYLVGFPYGCVEQTMSRFMPSVVATRALREAGYDGVDDERLPEYVAGGLERLARFQHADGGWGWWESDETNAYMTAYVVAGLAEAKAAGAPVNATMLARGIDALRKIQAAERQPNLAAYEGYALARAGSPPASWPAIGDLSLDGIALLGLGQLAAGDRAGAEAAAQRLSDAAVRSGTRIHWDADGVGWGRHSIRSDVQLTAHALRLFAGLGRTDETPLIVMWLADQRQGPGWATTKDTSESVLGVLEHLATSDELTPDFEAVVRVEGVERRVEFRGEAKDLARTSFTIPLDLATVGEAADISITRSGTGRLYWTATLSATPHMGAIPAESAGLTVTKRILDGAGREVSRLAFDEEATIRLTVTTPVERSFVMLEDMLPAGVEVLKDPKPGQSVWEAQCWSCSWGWPWTNVEARDDRVAAFATSLPAGTSTLEYRVRAMHPGSFHVLPARAEAMYDPALYGRSEDLHLDIGGVPKLLIGEALVRDGVVSVTVLPSRLTVAASDVTATLHDASGAAVPLAGPALVTAYDDGSLRVTLDPVAALPARVTLSVAARDVVAVRTLDFTGQAVRFDGTFSAALDALWAAGPVVSAVDAARQSATAVGAVFQPPPNAQQQGEVAWTTPGDVVPRLLPAEQVPLMAGVAVATALVGALVVRRIR